MQPAPYGPNGTQQPNSNQHVMVNTNFEMTAQPQYHPPQPVVYVNQNYNQQGYAHPNMQMGPQQGHPMMQPQHMMMGGPMQPMQAQPMVMVHPGSMMPLFKPRMSGFDKLMQIPGVYLKQKFMVMQAVTGCSQAHKHFVYALDANGQSKKGNKMFKCKEHSDFMSRQFTSSACRSFDMEVNHKDYIEPGFDNSPFVRFEREFKCTCCCLSRPVLKVINVENGQNELLGYVKEPYKCCSLQVDIYGPNDELKFTIPGECCQMGVMCKGPCCQEVHFDIKDANDNVVGALNKVSAGFFGNMVETVANFTVNFPVNANGGDRIMLIAAAIMIDYAYFDQKSQGAMNRHNTAEQQVESAVAGDLIRKLF